MKKIYPYMLLLFVVFFSKTAFGQFTHPGIQFNKADLDRMKARLNIDPWKSGFAVLSGRATASINYVMQGPFQEVGGKPDIHRSQFESDMNAVQDQAIMWYMTGNSAYAQKAIQIIDAWATTHTIWSGETWSGLERGLFGLPLVTGAEILRYTYPGWTTTETNNCNNYFLNMYWNAGGPWTDPVNDNLGTGNQGQATIMCMIGVAIAINDTAKYNYIVNAFRNNTCVSLNRSTLATGQNVEAGRDQAHSMIELAAMTGCAEIASKQGTDLYADLGNRLLAVSEYWTSYNLGNTVPYTAAGPCANFFNSISAIDRGLKFPTNSLQQTYGAYVLRKGLAAPYTDQYRTISPVDDQTFLFDQEAVPATPGVPTGLKAAVGYSEVVLDWSSPLGAVSYNIKRSTTSGGPYTTIANGYNGTIYVDATVTNNTNYYYVVSAMGSNESANSAQVFAKPQNVPFTDIDIGAVATPGSASSSNGTWTVTGAGGDISNAADQFNFAYAPMTGSGSVTVRLTSGSQGKVGVMMRDALNPASQFVMVIFDSGSLIRMAYRGSSGDINTYYLTNHAGTIPQWLRLTRSGTSFTGYYSSDGLSWNVIGTQPVAMSNAINVGLSVCGRGALRTVVYDNITLKGATATPKGLAGVSVSNTENDLTWNTSPDLNSYNIYRSTTSGGPYSLVASNITGSAYNNQGLTKGTYYYVITGVNGYGESGYSSEISITPVPDAPTGVAVTAGNAQSSLRWNPVPNATMYKVKRSTKNGTGYTTIASITNTVFNDTPLSNDTTYYYVVTVSSSTGESSNSSQVTVTPNINATPTLFWAGTVNAVWDLATLNWKKSTATSAFQTGNAVWFDDSAAGNTTISLSSALSPANVIFNNSTLNYTIGGSAMNGAMYLVKSGTKTVTLNATNGFTGGVILNDGILSSGSASTFGTGALTLNGGVLQLANNNLTYSNDFVINGSASIASGTISGFKGLTYNGTLSGNGTVKFLNNSVNNMPIATTAGANWNAFTGTLIYEEGGVNKTFTWTFTPALNLKNANLIVQNTINQTTNTLTLNAASTSYVGALSQSGSNKTLISIATGGTLSIGNLNANTIYGGIISGGGGVELTGGSLSLSGANTYTGPTTINGGRLDVTGSLTGNGNVLVNSGVLGGLGSVTGQTIVSANGKVSLANSKTNVFNTSGGLTLNGGSSLDFEIGGGVSDQVNVNGAYTPPTSGTVNLNLFAISGFTSGTYSLIKGAAGIDASNFSIGTTPDNYDCSLIASNGTLSVIITTIPPAPDPLTAVLTGKKATLTWPVVLQAASYNVKRSNFTGGPYTPIATGMTQHTYQDSLITPGTNYYYVVSSVNASGEGSNSIEASIVVPKSDQTITFHPFSPKTDKDADFDPGATATSALPVLYNSSDTTVAKIIGSMVHMLKSGSTTITAAQPGNSVYNAAPSQSQTLKVAATQSITFNPLPVKTDEDSDFSPAATASSGLQVSYTSSDTTVATIYGLNIHLKGAGTTMITASQPGDSTFTAAEPKQQILKVKASQVLTFNAIPSKTMGDADFAPGASASSGLPVSYTSSDTTVATISGLNIHIKSAGNSIITTTQAGDSTFIAAEPKQQTLKVKSTQTLVFAAIPTKTTGDADFNPGASSGSGLPVSYTSSDTSVAAVIGSNIRIVAAGTTTITALQTGDDNYAAAAPLRQTLKIKSTQTLIFAAMPTKTTGDADFNPGASSSSGLPVSYTSSDTTVATVLGSNIHIVGAGTTNITASQTGENNYAQATAIQQPLQVKGLQTITFNAIPAKADDDPDFDPAASSSSGLMIEYTSSDTTVAKITASKIHIVKAGTSIITAKQSGSNLYASAMPLNNLLTVKIHQTIAFAPVPSKLKGDPDFSLNASVSSSLPVIYMSSNPLVAQISGGSVHIVGAGNTTITATQAGNSSYAAALPKSQLLIVSPLNIMLNYLNTDYNNPTDNNIKPDIQLLNNTSTSLNYSEFKIRYWFTPENYAGINTWVDYAQIGSGKVRLNYLPADKPRGGALGYVEYSFDPASGTLQAGSASGPIRTRFANADWSVLNEADDYSYINASGYQANSHMTVYRNGLLVWGTEPEPVTPQAQLTVLHQNINTNPQTNTISTFLQINNAGNVPLNYSDISIRYWFTSDGISPLTYWIDYAKLGSSKVTGQFIKTSVPLNNADTYLEVKINSSAGVLNPLSSSGNIQYRITKSNWSNFNETNDFSYLPAAPFAANPHITAYYKGALIYGTEPGNNTTQSFIVTSSDKPAVTNSINEVTSLKNNLLYPNPVISRYFFIKVTPDLFNKVIQTRVYDTNGSIVFSKKLQTDDTGIIRVDLNGSTRLGVYTVILDNLTPLKLIYQGGN